MKTWIHRTVKNKKDFYQTNPRMIKALIDNFSPVLSNSKIIDPCCGNHIIHNVLLTSGISVDEFDLYPFDDNTLQCDFLDCGDILTTYDTIIMNPPYSSKYLFLDHALKYFKNVFCLLPEISLNYNIMNEKYLSAPQYWGKLKMYPKMFLHEGIEDKFGGTTCYSWLYFSNDRLCQKHKNEIIVNLLKE
jgi:hypothetical protein